MTKIEPVSSSSPQECRVSMEKHGGCRVSAAGHFMVLAALDFSLSFSLSPYFVWLNNRGIHPRKTLLGLLQDGFANFIIVRHMCTIAYAVVYCGSSNNLYMVHLHQCGHTMIQNSPFSPKKDGTPNRCGCSVEAQRRHKIRARHFPELERKNPWINHQHQLSCNYFYGPLTA